MRRLAVQATSQREHRSRWRHARPGAGRADGIVHHLARPAEGSNVVAARGGGLGGPGSEASHPIFEENSVDAKLDLLFR